MWWQRCPPEGWHFVKNVGRAVVMEIPFTREAADYECPRLGLIKRGWTTCRDADGGWFKLVGGGTGRTRNGRGMPLPNNDGDYTMRVVVRSRHEQR